MSTPDDNQAREILRQYLLGTLEEDQRILIEERLEKDETFAALCEEERQSLAVLDSLNDDAAPAGLSNKVLEEIQPQVPNWIFRTAFMTALVLVIGPFIYLVLSQIQGELGANRATNNLAQIGAAFNLYADDNQGEKYPPLAPYEDVWIFDVQVLYPDYLPELSLLVSPNIENSQTLVAELQNMEAKKEFDWERVSRIAAQSYSYLGWATRGPEEFEKLGEERRLMAKNEYDRDMDIAGNEFPFFQIRQSIERFQTSAIDTSGASEEARSEVLVMFETSEVKKQNKNQGVTALYLDGHTRIFEDDDPMLDYGDLDVLLTGDGDD